MRRQRQEWLGEVHGKTPGKYDFKETTDLDLVTQHLTGNRKARRAALSEMKRRAKNDSTRDERREAVGPLEVRGEVRQADKDAL